MDLPLTLEEEKISVSETYLTTINILMARITDHTEAWYNKFPFYSDKVFMFSDNQDILLLRFLTKDLFPITDNQSSSSQTDFTHLQNLSNRNFPINGAYTNGSYYLATGDAYLGNSMVHTGIDYKAEEGTSVVAYVGGVVTTTITSYTGSTYATGVVTYGNEVRITTYIGEVFIYAHLSSVDTSQGDLKLAGTSIGGVGTTGYSTGNHLHFERRNTSGSHIDPVT